MVPSIDENADLFEKVEEMIQNQVILVTGGTGSIGGEIVKALLSFDPQVIRVLSNDESSLFNFNQEIDPEKRSKVRLFLGDIRDLKRVERAMENVDIVFHAAALKHVEINEYNPFEAIKTNIMGTQNVIDAALKEGIKRFISISTDKAASPLNVMGATKLLAEKLVSAGMFTRGSSLQTKFISVRFGNVFGSRGSVYPKLKRQILRNYPVTITNPNMTRFIMSINDAIKLVFFAFVEGKGGEVIIPIMKSIRVDNLIEGIVDYVTTKYDVEKQETNLENIDVLPGEKMHEDLLSLDEIRNTYRYKNYLIFKQPNYLNDIFDWSKLGEKPNLENYSSKDSPKLSKQELFELIDEYENQ